MAIAIGLLAVAATMARPTTPSRSSSPTQTMVVEGTLMRASWRNPHSLFLVQGKLVNGRGRGPGVAVEGPSPAQLTRNGWTNEVSKVGRQGDVHAAGRAATASLNCCCSSVTLADGKVFSFIPD